MHISSNTLYETRYVGLGAVDAFSADSGPLPVAYVSIVTKETASPL